MATRAAVKTLNKTVGQIAKNAQADAERKAESKARAKAEREAAKTSKAHAHNLDVAQRELDRRNAEGEDVSAYFVDQQTAEICKTETPTPEPTESELASKAAAKQAADDAAFKEALTVDAKAVLGDDADQALIDAYIAEQMAPVKAAEKHAYIGPMTALREAAKHYVRGIHCGDLIATTLDGLTREQVVSTLGEFLLAQKVTTSRNPYIGLNHGQQSMNLRNKLRGALKNGNVTEAAFVAAIDAIKNAPKA